MAAVQMLEGVPARGELEAGGSVEVLVRFLSSDAFDSDEFLQDTSTPVEVFCHSLPEIFAPIHLQVR